MGRATGQGLRGWLLLGALALLLALPALLLPNPFGTDGPVHIRWQAAFAREVWQGTLWPRWLPGMNAGFGSPAFFFYPPVLQGLGAAFVPIFPGDAGAIRRLALALAVLSLLGAQGCRLWLRALGASQTAALLAAALWLVMPYRAFVDMYQRCALAESANLCLLPWLAYGAVRLAQGRRGGWGLHALAIGLLAYTHLPGMLIGYLFAGIQGLALVLGESRRERRWPLLIALASSALAGLALAAAMLVPALSLLGQLTDTAAMMGERNQPHNWLLFSAKPWIDPVAWRITLGLVAMSVGMAAMLFWPAVSTPVRRQRVVAVAMVLTVLGIAFLNLEISRRIWELQTPLSRIQFPFRLLGEASLALCLLAGFAHDRFARAGQAWRQRLLWLMFVGLLALGIAGFAYQRLRPRDDHPLTVAQVLASDEDSSEYVLGDLAGARHRFGPRLAFAPDAPVAVSNASIANRHITLDYRAEQSSTLALRQFAFTGWQCRIDGGAWSASSVLKLGANPNAARVPLCAVPGGAHRLEARLPAPPVERYAGWLSLGALAVILLSLLGASRNRSKLSR